MSVIYLILETVLAITLVLGAHALRRRFGLGLFFSSLAFLAAVTYWVTATGLTTVVGSVSFRVSSTAFFSALLVGIFATYVLDGPRAGRAGMAVISAVAVLWPAIGQLITLHFISVGQTSPLLSFPGARIVLSSIGAIVIDLVFLAICWELANKLLSKAPVFPRVFIVLLAVMWLDVVVFCVAAFSGNPNLLLILKGGIFSRFVVALAVSPLLAYYLKFQMKRYGLEFETRPLLAIFSQFDPEKLLLKAQSETRQKELELYESEERFKTYVSFAPDGIFIADGQGRYLDVNDAACRQTGYSREELLDMAIPDVLSPEMAGQAMRSFNKLKETGRSTSELKFRHKDGQNFHMVVDSVRLTENRFMAYCKDITDRVIIEKELRESETKLRAIIDNEPECVKIVAADGTLLEMNPAGLGMICASSIDMVAGKSVYDLINEEDREAFQQFNERVCAGAKESLSYQMVDLQGSHHHMESTAVPFSYQPDGTTVQLAITRDVTEQRHAEEERQSLERQVQHAQKLESLGILAGGIAHDFNNILMAILGNADLALDQISPHAPVRENLKEIEKASRRAAALAKQMLAYSGKGKFVIEPIYLNEFVKEMVHMLEVSISKKAVIKYYFADDLPVFQADATQIRQVIMNLITNASEATGDQSGIIAISTGVMECSREYLDSANVAVRAGLDEPLLEGVYIYLEVADTGCGMDLETQEKIFDPFYTTKFTGRGLGMAAVLGIIRGHGGAIKIYSEVGRGTTIKVLFPADIESIAQEAQNLASEAKAEWQGSGTILLADDEESIRAVGKLMLQRLGFKVITAEDGQVAVDLFREHQAEIVCVLLDLTMPHLGGEDAFREIRAIKEGVKVVLCSGYNEQEATQHFTGKGLSGFIQKPFAKPELLEQLEKLLGC